MRWQTGAAVALLAALATVAVLALAGDGGPPEVAASPGLTVSPSPTPSPSPVATPSPSPTPELVLPDNDVDDPLEAIVAIEAYRDWLFENPDPDLVRFIFHEGCGCRGPLENALRGLREKDERIVLLGDPRIENLVAEPDGDRVMWVDYDLWLPGAQQVAADGSVVHELPAATEATHQRVRLLREPNGRWRVLRWEDSSRA